jgi:hypothetical protein
MAKGARLGMWPDQPPAVHSLMAVIRKLANDAGAVDWSEHAMDRLYERGITDLDALKVLRNGDNEGRITAGQSKAEWQCKVICEIERGRTAGVVTVVLQDRRLFIKTVEWEDPR